MGKCRTLWKTVDGYEMSDLNAQTKETELKEICQGKSYSKNIKINSKSLWRRKQSEGHAADSPATPIDCESEWGNPRVQGSIHEYIEQTQN